VTDRVRWAVLKLFQGNPVGYGSFDARLSKGGLPGSPADFAAIVGAGLPDFIPRKHMMHLDVLPVRDAGPTSIPGKAKETIKEEGDNQREGRRVGETPAGRRNNQ
jgi:hypothetical protein